MNYNMTSEIETALAVLPLKPKDDSSIVPTHFWVDNFDVTVEMDGGGSSVNTTHLVAFQEETDCAIHVRSILSIERTRKKTFECKEVVGPCNKQQN